MDDVVTIADVDHFLSASHFVVACEFLKNAIVPKISQRNFYEFLRILKIC